MKRTFVFILLCLFIPAISLDAQQMEDTEIEYDVISAGLGMGLDYGGFGGNLMYFPSKNVGLFAGAGYALAGLGFNAGIKIRNIPQNPTAMVAPFALAMYGYNAAIKVSNVAEWNKLFYGPTLGAGVDLRLNSRINGYWSFAILIPFRSPEVKEYIDDLESNHGVVFENELFPIGLSFGYRIMFGR